ncbi:MAG: hypothetical protein WCL44_07445, partial [bacterium]
RIDPAFDGDFKKVQTGQPSRDMQEDRHGVAGFAGTGTGRGMSPAEMVSSIGMPQPEHLQFASAAVASLPPALTEAAGEPFGASALLYGLLANSDGNTRAAQMNVIASHAGQAIHDETLKLLPWIDAVQREHRLPLAELAIAGLQGLSKTQYDTFCDATVHLIEADDQVDLFEYTLQRMIVRHLEPVFRSVAKPVTQYYDISPLLPHCAKLLSCLAYWGADDQASAEKAFFSAAGKLGASLSLKLLGRNQCGLTTVDEALGVLELAAPPIKKRILSACAACVATDDLITAEEAELLRVVADALNCPVPPFVPGLLHDRITSQQVA